MKANLPGKTAPCFGVRREYRSLFKQQFQFRLVVSWFQTLSCVSWLMLLANIRLQGAIDSDIRLHDQVGATIYWSKAKQNIQSCSSRSCWMQYFFPPWPPLYLALSPWGLLHTPSMHLKNHLFQSPTYIKIWLKISISGKPLKAWGTWTSLSSGHVHEPHKVQQG